MVTQLRDPLWTGHTPQLVKAEVSEPGLSRKHVGDQILGRAGEQGLASAGQIPDARRSVDAGTGVVALVVHLRLSGMHTDAQPDRGQRRPLQLQCARSRLARAGERDHKAVALTLLDRPHPAVGGEQVS